MNGHKSHGRYGNHLIVWLLISKVITMESIKFQRGFSVLLVSSFKLNMLNNDF